MSEMTRTSSMRGANAKSAGKSFILRNIGKVPSFKLSKINTRMPILGNLALISQSGAIISRIEWTARHRIYLQCSTVHVCCSRSGTRTRCDRAADFFDLYERVAIKINSRDIVHKSDVGCSTSSSSSAWQMKISAYAFLLPLHDHVFISGFTQTDYARHMALLTISRLSPMHAAKDCAHLRARRSQRIRRC